MRHSAHGRICFLPKVVTEASGLQAFSDLKRSRHFYGTERGKISVAGRDSVKRAGTIT